MAIAGTANNDTSIAIGDGAVTNAANAIAIGKGVGGSSYLNASENGALATGSAKASNKVEATGKGSRAHGAPDNGVLGHVEANGVASDAIGEFVTASGDYTEARGIGAVAINRGESVRSSYCDITLAKQDKGKHQSGTVLLQGRTTNATATRLCTDSLVGTGANWTPTDYRVMALRVKIAAKDGAGLYAVWIQDGMIDKQAGVISVYNPGGASIFGPGGATPTYHVGGGMGGINIAVTASGGDVVVTANGIAATVIRWTCEFEYTQAGENP